MRAVLALLIAPLVVQACAAVPVASERRIHLKVEGMRRTATGAV